MMLEMRFVRGAVIAAAGAIAVVLVAAQPAAAHERAAGRAAFEMTGELGRIDAELLTVETGGDGSSRCIAMHAW